MMQECV
jgi:hypothetical protein